MDESHRNEYINVLTTVALAALLTIGSIYDITFLTYLSIGVIWLLLIASLFVVIILGVLLVWPEWTFEDADLEPMRKSFKKSHERRKNRDLLTKIAHFILRFGLVGLLAVFGWNITAVAYFLITIGLKFIADSLSSKILAEE
jgi:hypothetical protein